MTGIAPLRRRLPNRRPSLTRTINVGNRCFEVTVGIDPVDGQPREVFLDGAKDGGELAVNADQATVMAAVQALGYTPESQDEADALAILNHVAGGT